MNKCTCFELRNFMPSYVSRFYWLIDFEEAIEKLLSDGYIKYVENENGIKKYQWIKEHFIREVSEEELIRLGLSREMLPYIERPMTYKVWFDERNAIMTGQHFCL